MLNNIRPPSVQQLKHISQLSQQLQKQFIVGLNFKGIKQKNLQQLSNNLKSLPKSYFKMVLKRIISRRQLCLRIYKEWENKNQQFNDLRTVLQWYQHVKGIEKDKRQVEQMVRERERERKRYKEREREERENIILPREQQKQNESNNNKQEQLANSTGLFEKMVSFVNIKSFFWKEKEIEDEETTWLKPKSL